MWIAILGAATVAAASGSLWLLPHEQAAAVSAGAAIVFVACLARGMFSVRSSLVETTHWRSDDARETRVALTFDDGPHPRWTPAVLDELRSRDVRATFFVIGENVRRHPEIVRRIRDEGHDIGCHGDSHAWTTPLFSRRRIEAEIQSCLDAVRAAAGVTPRLWRPPVGIRSPGHAGVARSKDLLTIGMARRGFDARPGADSAAFARRFAAAAGHGEILALHDGEEPLHPASREATVAALPAILDGLAAKGLRPTPVSELLAVRPYRETPSRGWTGRSLGGRLGMAIFARTARHLGARGCLAVAPLVAGWCVVAQPRARRASVQLRRRLRGPGGAVRETAWAFRHFLVFGRTIIDRMAFLHGGARPPETQAVGFADVREVAESKDGFLLVSGHVGDWIAASRVAKLGGRPLSVVAAQGMGVGPHQVRRDARTPDFRVIDLDADAVTVGAQIAAALHDGGVVAMLGDRRVSGDVVRLPFLGGAADFPTGPWAVAMATGAPVVVFFAVRLADGRHRIEFHGPIRVPRGPRAERLETIRVAASRFVVLLEDVVRRHPFQWSNFYDFWTVE